MLFPLSSIFRILLLGLLLLLVKSSCGQEPDLTVYFDALLKQTQRRHAIYSLQLTHVDSDIYEGTIFSDQKEVKAIGQWKKIDQYFQEHGQFVFFHPNGQIESQGEYDRGIKIGYWQRFESNGTRKADRYYNPESAALIRQTQGVK